MMPKYFFHLLGDVPAHDLIGHDCASDKEAKQYGRMLAHNVGANRPDLINDNNYISVVNDGDRELFKIPLTTL